MLLRWFILLLRRSITKCFQDAAEDVLEADRADQEYARFILRTAEGLLDETTTLNLNVIWPIYMTAITLSNLTERDWALYLLEIVAKEKGWKIAYIALHSAMYSPDGKICGCLMHHT